MSSVIEYCLSVTPEPYESAPTPEDISVEEIEAQAATEESYVEAMARHAAWKEAKIAAEWEDKLRLACEVWAAKVEALKQKVEEKRKAEEKRKEEEWLRLLKEQEDATEAKRLEDLKAKELEEATEKKRRDDLEKKEKKDAARKLRKEWKRQEKAKKAMESIRLLVMSLDFRGNGNTQNSDRA